MDTTTNQTPAERQGECSVIRRFRLEKHWKVGIGIAIAIASIISIIQVFSSSWAYHKPESGKVEKATPDDGIKKDMLLSLAQRNDKLVVGKVHLEGTGWEKKDTSAVNMKFARKWFKKTSIRAWSSPCEVDAFIDTGKLNEQSFNLVVDENGRKRLTITLPEPEIDQRQLESMQTDQLYLVFSEGDLESGELLDFQTKSFRKIRNQIEEVVGKNLSGIVDMAKNSAKNHFICLFRSLGIEAVDIEWASNPLRPEAWETDVNGKSIN